MTSSSSSSADAGFKNISLDEIGIPDSEAILPLELWDLDFAECDWMSSGDAKGQRDEEQQQYIPSDVLVDMSAQQAMYGQDQRLDEVYWLSDVPGYNSGYYSDYDMGYAYQDMQTWSGLPMDSQPLGVTSGLSALPGASDFTKYQQPVDHGHIYQDPSTLGQSALPFFSQPGPFGHTGFASVQPELPLAQGGAYNTGSQQLSYDFTGLDPPSYPSPSESGSNYSDESSDDEEEQDDKPVVSSKPVHSPAASAFSDTTLSKSVEEQPEYRKGETPKKDHSKSWIRINGTTKGESTRTSKVNNWKNTYKYRPLPIGDWQTDKYKFEYRSDNGLDFFKKIPMPTRQIEDYIKSHPGQNDRRLILWIQQAPADSGRRAGSAKHFKCIFKECPIQKYGEGTIACGEYRVAFDEKHAKYRNDIDPFDCVGFAHLYCMERFMDLPMICRIADVRVDTRDSLPREPRGKSGFTLTGHAAFPLIERFFKAAAKDMLWKSSNFVNYPVHEHFIRGGRKPHENTLIYQIHKIALRHLPDSQQLQFATRPPKTGQRDVHLGDLEIAMTQKKIKAMLPRKKLQAPGFKIEHYYDQCDPTISERLRKRAVESAEIIRLSKARGTPKIKAQNKRKAIELSDDEGEEPSPSARHIKKQRHYGSPYHSPSSRHHINTSYAQANRKLRRSESSPATPKTSCSDLFPREGTLDISDFPLDQEDIPAGSFERLMAFNAGLERRVSLASPGLLHSSIMNSPVLRRSVRPARQASFNIQPVSSRAEYFRNDPPSRVAASPRPLFERRSTRVAAMAEDSKRRGHRQG